MNRLFAYGSRVLTFYWQFGAGFVVGALYVAVLLTVPGILHLVAARLL